MNRDKKKILVLPRWYPNKTDIQLGVFIQRQAILMSKLFEINVIYVQSIKDLTDKYELIEFSDKGINETIVYFKKGKGPLKKLINFRRYLKAQKIAYKKLNNAPDLVHIQTPYKSALFALLLKRKHKIPFLITEHWSGHLAGEFHTKNGLDKFLYKYVLKQASKISAVSKSLSIAFKKNTGFNAVIIPNYIEKSEVPAIRDSNDKISILTVSDFNDQIKNISGLLHAFKKALNQSPSLHLTIVGGGPDEKMINDLIAKLQFNKNELTVKGRLNHSKVLEEMTKADFYICNSRYETFGMTIAEALINGIPVISTPCGGPNSFLNKQNSITLSSSNNETNEELTNAILKMANTYTDFDNDSIKKDIENKFGKEAVSKKWHEFYNN